MKKNLLFLLAAAIFSPIAFYGQQLENPGFEEWEDAGTVIQEPVDWSSIKTSDGGDFINNAAPQVWDKSTDAHSGNFAIKLINREAFSLVATGTMTNGRVHAEFDANASYTYTDPTDPRWNTVFTARPDSIVIWAKQYPKENDFSQIKIVLHTGEAKLPENGTMPNWVGFGIINLPTGNIETWTRYAAPIDYFNDSIAPEHVLVVINSGNGVDAIDSSYAFFDDVELVYGPQGIPSHKVQTPFMHYQDGQIRIDMDNPSNYMNCLFQLVDMSGRTLYSKKLSSSIVSNLPEDLKQGVYVAVLQSKKGQMMQKFYIH
jgi:hypothetical protein